MSATLGASVKAYIEGAGLGVSVFGRRVPQGHAYPYVTVADGVARTPDTSFSQYDDDDGHVTELITVDVWQNIRVAGARVEDPELPEKVELALRGCRLPTAPFNVAGVRVVSSRRVPDPDPNVAHDAITVAASRTLARS